MQYKRVKVGYFKELFKPGNVVNYFGFMSTTYTPDMAVKFAAGASKNPDADDWLHKRAGSPDFVDISDAFVLHIRLPKKYPYFHIARGEAECVLGYTLRDGTVPRYRVIRRYKKLHRMDLTDVDWLYYNYLGGDFRKHETERLKSPQKIRTALITVVELEPTTDKLTYVLW